MWHGPSDRKSRSNGKQRKAKARATHIIQVSSTVTAADSLALYEGGRDSVRANSLGRERVDGEEHAMRVPRWSPPYQRSRVSTLAREITGNGRLAK